MHLRSVTVTAALTAAVSLPATAVAYAQPSGADKDCSDFDTQLEAQHVLDGDPLDFFRLDADEDGIACETLPGTQVGASATATGAATPNASPTGAPATVAPATLRPTGAVPTGAVPAGAGGAADGGPSDVLLPLGLAATTLAVGGGVITLARRRAHDRADG